jgi:hypothetical protein
MDESFHTELCWGPRLENAAECAPRFARSLTGLAASHPAFAQWVNQGNTRAEAVGNSARCHPKSMS